MDAIIYCAGRSTRMGPAFKQTHKILLKVGERTLLEWHVHHLAALGIERVYVVTGYLREQVAAHLGELQSRYPTALHEIFNEKFEEGSVLSVSSSLPVLEKVRESVLLMDGDVLYDRELLQRLVRSPHPTVLLVDFEYQTIDDDPVLVPVRDGRPFEFLKKWAGLADRVGESVGFFKLQSADVALLVEDVENRLGEGRRLDSYDEVVRTLVRAGRFDLEDVTGLPWTEIDFPYDLELARTTVLPEILGRLASSAGLSSPGADPVRQ